MHNDLKLNSLFMDYSVKTKCCFISAVSDDKFIEWYKTLVNLPKNWEIYILRNKSIKKETLEFAQTIRKSIIKVVPNENYREPTLTECNIKFVKLRFDSLMLSQPKEDEWIMFGDDDMFILEGFSEDIKQLDDIADRIDWCVASHLPHHAQVAKDAVFEGIRHGQYFKYKTKAFEEYLRFIDCVGAGEDSLLAIIYYKFYRVVAIFLPSVNHKGANLSTYLSTQYHPLYLSSKVFAYIEEGFTQEQLFNNGQKQRCLYANIQHLLLPYYEKDLLGNTPPPLKELQRDCREKSNDGRPFVCGLGDTTDKRICKFFKPLGNRKTHICHWYAYNNMCVCPTKITD